MSDFLWLIPIFPAIGFLVNGLAGRRISKRAVSAVACGVVLVSFVLSCAAVVQLATMPSDGRYMENRVGPWVPAVETVAGRPAWPSTGSSCSTRCRPS